ncbi:ATP citrate (pro-S)-lyase [Monoraphidium neglectum]|uniref:ATP citrate (Pro-S)-lyase n=1 Tax=Monoraphidium neglectum TaxID=145388 RepID=A0A0D2MLF8_9CHLO|nr:ATP citrate (pro-S)-lyase [Monoraphidium neglectum]KIZ03705.1 ATP citrate (pro-S)-lyase [Monoraphidium neglectum]|eukprot:XP_013902724.1 ATP citrate (pro-S)-lyase [Monoraphidium neglectum]
MELDDTAAFRWVWAMTGVGRLSSGRPAWLPLGRRNSSKWGDVEFPLPFGRTLTAAEQFVTSLDEATGASLKFTVLNPKGRVWLMVAGGGASVIYADTVGDLGFAQVCACDGHM